MMQIRKILLLLLAVGWAFPSSAGNPERLGQAGATQLLINSYGRSSGIGGLNPSFVMGIESITNNIGGLAVQRGTNAMFTHTRWLSGSDIGINTVGLSQSLGQKGGVVGIHVQAFDFGDIERTTINNPDGDLGTFSPSFLNIAVAYGQELVKDQIYVGLAVKVVSESVPDASSTGVGFDAGVQYHDRTGKFKLGVALRNIGPTLRYTGDGLTVRAELAGSNAGFDNAVQIEAEKYEMPSELVLGLSYDFHIGGYYKRKGQTDSIPSHRITPTGGFRARAYGYDQIGLGVEYSFRDWVAVRVAQFFEQDIFSENESLNAHTGLSAGISLQAPLGKGSRTSFGVDYSYRHTYFFSGTHTIGARFGF